MGTLHVISGKAGAGKTTLARELGNTLPAVVFCEDEWIATLGFEVAALEDYLRASSRCRALIGPLAAKLLRLGVSVVFDFGGNTAKSRLWVREVFESASADHVLHVIDATDAQCLDNVRRRNREKPDGVYWGDVSDDLVQKVNAYVTPPDDDEGFRIIRHPVSSDRI